MTAQERKPAKNFIGLLCETAEEPCTTESLPRSDRNFFIGMILALLNRMTNRDAKQGSQIESLR